MPPFHPTPREILLLILLFGCLLFFTANLQRRPGHVSDLIRSPYIVEDEVTAKPLTLETQYTLQTLNAPLSWGTGPVPETKIIAHVPGESYFRLVRACGWTWLSLDTRNRRIRTIVFGPIQSPSFPPFCPFIFAACLLRPAPERVGRRLSRRVVYGGHNSSYHSDSQALGLVSSVAYARTDD